MNQFSPEFFFDLSDTPAADLFSDITHVWDAITALPSYVEDILKPEILGEIEEGAWLEPGAVRLEKGSRVERGAVVRGPTIIGPDTVIRSGAYIRGHVMIGRECIIGTATEINLSLVLNKTNLPHQNCIFTSLVGNRVNLGGCTSTANYLLSGKEVEVRLNLNGEKLSFPTGRTHFGAVIGDDSRLGGQSIIHPGTVIGKRCTIYPQSAVTGFIPNDSKVKPQSVSFHIISEQ